MLSGLFEGFQVQPLVPPIPDGTMGSPVVLSVSVSEGVFDLRAVYAGLGIDEIPVNSVSSLDLVRRQLRAQVEPGPEIGWAPFQEGGAFRWDDSGSRNQVVETGGPGRFTSS